MIKLIYFTKHLIIMQKRTPKRLQRKKISQTTHKKTIGQRIQQRKILFKKGPLTYAMPEQALKQISRLFPKRSIESLTKMTPEQSQAILNKLLKMPTNDFNQLLKSTNQLKTICSKQTAKYLAKTNKTESLPFEDFLQTIVAAKMMKESQLRTKLNSN